MKHAVRAVVTLAFGVGLAAAAQAQGTYGQSKIPGRTPSAAPGAMMQKSAPEANPQAALPKPMERSATAHRRSRNEIKQAQEQLKSDGLYRGRIDGIIGRKTRAALARFQQRNGLRRTARLDQSTFTRLIGSRTTGVGSSAPGMENGSGATGAGGGSTAAPPAVLRGSSPSAPAPSGTNEGNGTANGGTSSGPTPHR
jgi:peptidoglycan hydrolase-like protein with peptidoglycan-binding domain